MSHADALRIEGARQNNLKNISLEIPHDRLTVVTGVSGSGKSSLAFDTLFAEGQWRYIESLSTYARMFLDRIDRPDVDKIEHVRPAVALEQKNPVRTARSTVGTATEVYDYLRLLYAKIGRVHCPTCGVEATSHSPEGIVDTLYAEHPGARALVTFRLPVPSGITAEELWAGLTRRGFARVSIEGAVVDLAQPPPANVTGLREIAVILDRIVLDERSRPRLSESVGTALREGNGRVDVQIVDGPLRGFAEALRCPQCLVALERPQPLLFSFNHPLGACPECKGFGNVLKYDEALVVPDPTRTLADGAVEPWTHPSGRWYQRELVKAARRLEEHSAPLLVQRIQIADAKPRGERLEPCHRPGLRDDRARLGVLEEVAHFPFLIGAVEGQMDEAAAQACEVEQQRLGGFLDLDGDAVPGLEPQFREERCVARAARFGVGIRNARTRVEQQERLAAFRGKPRFELRVKVFVHVAPGTNPSLISSSATPLARYSSNEGAVSRLSPRIAATTAPGRTWMSAPCTLATRCAGAARATYTPPPALPSTVRPTRVPFKASAARAKPMSTMNSVRTTFSSSRRAA